VSTEYRASNHQNDRRLLLVMLLFLVGLAVFSASTAEAGAPNTPWGVSPPVWPETTHPDSTQAWMARSGTLGHAPLAIAMSNRGTELAALGDYRAAIATWKRAAVMDPLSPTPTLAPVRYGLLKAPDGAFEALVRYPEILMGSFSAQQLTASNLLVLILFPLLIAAGVTSLLLFARHSPRLHHLVWENLMLIMPRNLAKWVVWAILLLPLVWQLGWLIWAAILLAATFPLLAGGERRFAVSVLAILLIAPLAIHSIALISGPADPAHPAAVQWRAQRSGANEQLMAEIRDLSARYPEDGKLYFSESLLARQAGDMSVARAALVKAANYRSVSDQRFATARGILAYQEGNIEEAIRQLASAVNGKRKAFNAHYNLAKAYARKSLFLKADREMKLAFDLDPQRVRIEDRRRLELQAQDLIEERLGCFDTWKILSQYRSINSFQLPAYLAAMFPGENPNLLWPSLLLLPPLIYLARMWNRTIQTHVCSHCGCIVCRRCLKRRQRRVYCDDCALTAGKWATQQYTQMLLTKVLGRHDRARDVLLDTGRFLIPGLGAVLRGNPQKGFWQLYWVAFAIVWLVSEGLPFKPVPVTRLDLDLIPPWPFGLGILAIVYGFVSHTEAKGLRKQSHLRHFLESAKPGGHSKKKAA
jgi:tetratricopeptide (TPR) repeat protein